MKFVLITLESPPDKDPIQIAYTGSNSFKDLLRYIQMKWNEMDISLMSHINHFWVL